MVANRISPASHRSQRSGRNRFGLTVMELLVTMSLIVLLLALLVPAVQALRETSRRTQCQNNLRQIGVAIHLHHDTQLCIPPGWREISGTSMASGWIPELLPYLEQPALQDKVRQIWLQPGTLQSAGMAFGRSETNAVSLADLATPAVLACPSDSAEDSFRLFSEVEHPSERDHDDLSDVVLMELPHSNYVGVAGVKDPDEPGQYDGGGSLIAGRKIGFRDLTNGLSQVALVSERTARRLPSTWAGFHMAGEDAAGRVLGFAFYGPNVPTADECEFDSRHSGGIQMLFADGHVRMVVDSIERSVYQSLARRSEP